MVGKEKFQNALLHFLDGSRFGENHHAFGRLRGAKRLRLGHHRDLRRAVFVERGRAVRVHFRHPDFAQAHAAHSDRRQFRVIAKTRHIDADLRGGFDSRRAFGNGNFLPVNGEGYKIGHRTFGFEVMGQRCWVIGKVNL